ncbi:MAG: DUF4830 domain-containing protein [Clostridia bacterium]|nr:DUF4830 domain-containing protein [Clostridia bacterium]
MKNFLKENITHILFLILVGVVLILWGKLALDAVSQNAAIYGLDSTEKRVKCIESYGWEVDETSETKEIVYIPKEFDDVYKRYNKIQKMSGFDLTKYRGKSVMRYTFKVLNFPYSEETEAFLNIFVYENKMIAGDCLTVALDGLMLPIDRRYIG